MDRGGRGQGLASETLSVPATAVAADRHEVRVPIPDDGHLIVDVRERRADVVARLLDLGVSVRCLTTLLPEWTELINAVAAERLDTR